MKLSSTLGAPDLGGRRSSAANLIFLFAAACSPATAHFNLFPDGDLQAANKKLRNPVQVDHIDHIISNSDVLRGADRCPDLFVAGTSFEEGDLVEKNTVVHRCKSWPYAQWCSMSGYEPDGDNSDKAWEVIGHCEKSIDPVPSAVVDEKSIDPVPSAVVDERKLAVFWGPAPYSPNNTDGASDQVFVTSGVTSGGGSNAYQCAQFPDEVDCNQCASASADRRDESCACVHLECLPDQTGVSITGLACGVCAHEMETHTFAAPVILSPTAASIVYAAPVSSSPISSLVTIELDAGSSSKAAILLSTMSTVIASKGVDGSKSSHFPTNKGIGEWFEVDLNSEFSGEGLEFPTKVCGKKKSSNVFLYDGAGNTEDTCERTTITMTIKPCSKSSPSKRPTKATTTTVSTESPSKNPSTLSPTVVGGYLDPFNKVNIQSTSDTDPNRSEVLVFSRGRRNSVSIYLKLIFCLSVIIIVVDVLVLDLPLQRIDQAQLDLPLQGIDQTQQSNDTKPRRKYIVVDLRLGLTNQAAAAWCAVLVAEKLNRTLVLPQVRAKIPKGEIVAEENGILEDFDYVWDSEHFIQCAREKLNKPGLIFATDRQHYDVEIHQNDTFELSPEQVPLLLDWNPALPIKYDFLGRFVGDNTSYVKVIQPISFFIAEKWNYLDCFVPSERLNKMIVAYKSKLPKEYACLHARTESDWYSHACCGKQGNTTSESIDEWNCPTHPVSETCYKTPQQIADMLKSKLDSNMTLWISSGSSREALQPLFDSWNVVTKDDLSPDLYMDYGLAEVDRMMCRDAKTFWGMGGSSFSEEVKKFFLRNGREAEWYARKDWCIDWGTC